jgi:hypothetical protein
MDWLAVPTRQKSVLASHDFRGPLSLVRPADLPEGLALMWILGWLPRLLCGLPCKGEQY